VVKLHNPRVVGLRKDIPLRPDVGNLLLLEHFGLAHYLHGVDLLVRYFPAQFHLDHTVVPKCPGILENVKAKEGKLYRSPNDLKVVWTFSRMLGHF